MRTGRSMRWLGLLGVLIALAGCGGGGKDHGVLVVPYELGNHRDCASLGISSVRAELDDGSLVTEGDCDTGQVRFNLLDPGNYDVVVYGLDDDGVAVMDSLVE